MHELFSNNNTNQEQLSEFGAIITILVFLSSFMFEYISESLHIIAFIVSILSGLGALFLNRKKYRDEILKTKFYKSIKDAFKKTKGRTP